MKTTHLPLLILLAITLSVHATVRTVNNGPLSGAQYTSAQEAIDASSDGDTIYLHGSDKSYGDITLKKRIVLLGAGHSLQETQYNMRSELGTIKLNRETSLALPTGSIFKGLYIDQISATNHAYEGVGLSINNITVSRCRITSSFYVTGNYWIISNNHISNIQIYNYNNAILTNNIITRLSNSNKPSVLISNNIFISGGYPNCQQPAVSNATITNNFFINPAETFGSYSGTNKQNTYSKNIFIYNDPLNFISLDFPNNSSSGNLNTAYPQFISEIPMLLGDPNIISTYNWNLQSTSIGKNYGTDGTDVGIYGGAYPMPNLSGAPNIPQMVSVNIQNPFVPKDGILQVNIEAKSLK